LATLIPTLEIPGPRSSSVILFTPRKLGFSLAHIFGGGFWIFWGGLDLP
jgi:hypothetical protein